MTTQTTGQPSVHRPGPPVVSDEAFAELMAGRSRGALRLATYLTSHGWDRPVFTRPLLGDLLRQATELEELLDAYGARGNRRWYPYRSTVAAGKLFARVNYVLLHIQHARPAYRLLEIEGDFAEATGEAIVYTGEVILQIAASLLEQAGEMGMPLPDARDCEMDYSEHLPAGRLRHDRLARKDTDAAGTVTYLATAFLNQAAESDLLHVPGRVEPAEYASCIPSSVSEKQLRQLQHEFHNLQSLYDTFVSDTDTERHNADLPVLRGHISVIFHLLETATELTHYYERHVMAGAERRPIVDGQSLLKVLMQYSLEYASRYLVAGRALCQEMLGRYAEVGRVEAPGPKYRGFHVRPSTLVAKIVHHYGSEVKMELEGETFDASSPMDIFRANERINRQKRTWLCQQMADLPALQQADIQADPVAAVRRVLLALAERDKIVIYQRPVPVRGPTEQNADESGMQYVLDEVKRLQATGVIDIEADVTVTFIGDKRVLADLKLLAESGYGEDNFGNNVPLPEPLTYLRR